jgi:P-type E1-E2 ATPase
MHNDSLHHYLTIAANENEAGQVSQTAIRPFWRVKNVYRGVLAALIGVPLEVHSIYPFLPSPPDRRYLNGAVAVSVLLLHLVGWPYFRGFWHSLLRLDFSQLDMDTLVSLSAYLAYGSAIYHVIEEQPCHMTQHLAGFMADPFITLSILSFSHWLGDRWQQRIQLAIAQKQATLAARVPQWVTLENRQLRPLTDVKTGTVIMVPSQTYVPIDGKLLSEAAYFTEESLDSGEQRSVRIEKFGTVYAGMYSHSHHDLLVEASCDGGQSRYNHLLNEILAPVRRLHNPWVNQALVYFVPLVLIASATTYFVWYYLKHQPARALNSALGILFGTCPCALALGVPLAMQVSRYHAFTKNLLIRHPQQFLAINQASTWVFDKTGTLTQLELREIRIFPGQNQLGVLDLVGLLEAKQNHPIAHAIMRYVHLNKLNPDLARLSDFNHDGEGVHGLIDGKRYYFGNAVYIQAKLSPVSQISQMSQMSHIGHQANVLILASDDTLLAEFQLEERLNSGAKALIAELNRQRRKICLLSGSQQAAVDAVARNLGITHYFAELRHKQSYIQDWQMQGERIVYVGDGFNDVTAALSSNVSIAVGRDAPLAAGAGLLSPDLNGVIEIIRLAQKTQSNIRQNLFASILYNLVVIGLLSVILPYFDMSVNHAIMGSVMALSSLMIILNALRLMPETQNSAYNYEPYFFNAPVNLSAYPLVYRIEGISCAACVNRVLKLLAPLERENKAKFDLSLPNDGVSELSIRELTIPLEILLADIKNKLSPTKFSLLEEVHANMSKKPHSL